MYLLVLAHPGCPGHSTESHKMVVVVVLGDNDRLWKKNEFHIFSCMEVRPGM